MCFCQDTNGVNFYNILTQEPDEKLTSAAGENFIGKIRGFQRNYLGLVT